MASLSERLASETGGQPPDTATPLLSVDGALARAAVSDRRFTVWSIINRRGVPEAYEYRVTWAGYSGRHARTWEPRQQLLDEPANYAPDLQLVDYWKDSGLRISFHRFYRERSVPLSIEAAVGVASSRFLLQHKC
ncbi:unnamed protein product [Phytophthora fragariaefolia]|uniref:Unnamed protein product n=1 Tax=Phytophthora fragariaefolia TaxID=1490495 RepID=A0A9W6U908_9STRA|nr:unnamed protein product [Phytophthora fragariaefolia]